MQLLIRHITSATLQRWRIQQWQCCLLS